jgi:hypothetical protein
MVRKQLQSKSRRLEGELEQLREAISTGAIADLDDLDEGQEALLRAAYPDLEDLAAILDLIRGEQRESR